VFPATSNKREIADKKMNEINNISGKSYEIHFAISSGNGADK